MKMLSSEMYPWILQLSTSSAFSSCVEEVCHECRGYSELLTKHIFLLSYETTDLEKRGTSFCHTKHGGPTFTIMLLSYHSGDYCISRVAQNRLVESVKFISNKLKCYILREKRTLLPVALQYWCFSLFVQAWKDSTTDTSWNMTVKCI